jgi:hypothetical protein
MDLQEYHYTGIFTMNRVKTIFLLLPFFIIVPLYAQSYIDQLLNVSSNGRVVGGAYIVDYMVQGTSLPANKYLNSAAAEVVYDTSKLRFITATWSVGMAYTHTIDSMAVNVRRITIKGTNMGGNRNTIVQDSFTKWAELIFEIKNPSNISLSITAATNSIVISDKNGTGSKTTYSGSTLTSMFIDNSILPVELTSFSGRYVNKNICLYWATATEVSNYGFDIERSIDNALWQKIGFVKGCGNCNSPRGYTFTDMTAAGNKYIYRLKQIDSDGKYQYSNIIEVKNIVNKNDITLYQNYPNPFNPVTFIGFSLPSEAFVVVKIFNSLGAEVAQIVNSRLPAGYNEIRFDASKLASGYYIYRIETASYQKNMKMILLK